MDYTLETFEKKIEKKFPNNRIKVLSFSGTAKPIEYQCLDCGKIYYKTRANHLYENKTLCQHCFSFRSSKIRDWIISFFERTNNFTLIEWSENTSDNILMKCNFCNRTFQKQPSNLYNREEETICPYCGENGSPVPFEDFILLLDKEKQEDYTFLNYKSMRKSCKIKHKCGFVFSQKPLTFLNSHGCPKCKKRVSLGEQKIENFLCSHNIKYETQKRFSSLNRLSFDFFLPDKNILIEYQGQQHFQPVNFFGGQEKFVIQKENDLKKKTFCEENNYLLICIPYYDYSCIEKYLLPLCSTTSSLERSTKPCETEDT